MTMNNKNIFDRITIVAGVCGGRPTIRGMRITVTDILELLAGGMNEQEILEDYPYLEREDIQASLNFAAKMSSFTYEQTPVSVA